MVGRGFDLEAFVRNRFLYLYLNKRPGKRRPHAELTSWPRDTPEARAQAWLAALIPDQALRYLTEGFVEVSSSLHEERVYRVNWGNCGTEILENEKTVAVGCMHSVDPDPPDTDRVIAEFFLLRGHEESYLKIANITPV